METHDRRYDLDGTIAAVTARRELADRIITAIAIGAFSPGQQLPPERELADRQKVSRVTVRGALQIVREKGLLNSRRGRGGGSFVTELNAGEVASDTVRRTLSEELPRLRIFVDFRCLIAALEARTAAERRTDEQARELEQIYEEFCRTDDLATARHLDRQLHSLITAMAANEELAVLVAQLNAKATMGFGSEPYPREYLDQARKEHALIVRSIATQDQECAYESAYRHFSLTFAIMEDAFKRVAGK